MSSLFFFRFPKKYKREHQYYVVNLTDKKLYNGYVSKDNAYKKSNSLNQKGKKKYKVMRFFETSELGLSPLARGDWK